MVGLGLGLGLTPVPVQKYPAYAPVVVVFPQISGSGIVGTDLTVTDGVWHGAPPITFDYQWERHDGTGWVPIGSNQNTYYLTSLDKGWPIRCHVTATNPYGPITVPSDEFPVPMRMYHFDNRYKSMYSATLSAFAA